MSKTTACGALEHDLIATASADATPSAAERVARHLRSCEGCQEEYARYRAVHEAVGELRATIPPPAAAARRRLLSRLADLRSRLVRYGVFATPLGPVLIAATEQGISLVEYVQRRDGSDSWLLRQHRIEPEADGAPLERFRDDLLDYLTGRRTRLDWPLDLRFARSDFQRAVLRATARVPFGAVSSYAGIASDIGRPEAVRAVAGALRHNPVPIVVPCHRIVGSGGALVGYAGTRIGLKERLLGVEGVRIRHGRRDAEIDRTAMYAWYRRDRAYCLPTCGSISEQPIGAVTLFASAREAEALGLVPCGDCRPDRHPLARRATGRGALTP
jgi:methylated-DNA-[protein]-cysteine S-methyltransferase